MARRWHHAVLTATALMPLAVAPAFAGPNGANVVGGAATVQGQGTASVVVNQTSQNAIINWRTFNIGSGETTKIFMPGSSSTQLDRVTGGQGPSQILGTLYSNGKVFLVNPDGILFGMGARINVGSLLATTNDIADKDFMAGRYNFTIPGNPNASIVNMGTITAQTGGFAALVAPGVRNTGTITAKLGTIALASGNAFTLDMYGDNLITLGLTDSVASQVVDVSTGQPLKSLIKNEGKLKADGGRVTLTAAAAREVVDSVINNTGVIEANSIGSRNGMIVLGAATANTKPAGAPTQTIKLSGTLSAKGKRNGTTGGTIIVTGENIAVSGATIDASGAAGGGKVLIGGDWGGGHPNTNLVSNGSASLEPYGIPNANTVSIDAATMIDASATGAGNGGKVIVWANQATTFLGTILAKGGAESGNGGFVETSSHGVLNYAGTVDLSAPVGTTGTLLLDPYNVTICQTDCGENYSYSDGIFSPTGSPSYLQASTLEAALSAANVIVTTGGAGSAGADVGNINVNASLNWDSARTLTINADNNININAAITAANGGLTLSAGNAISANAAVTVGTFTLQNGAWSQVGTLPAFSANNFIINGGSFLRASGGDGSSGSPYQIADVYGLQGIGSSSQLLASNYILVNAIDAAGTANWNGGSGFVPIGNETTNFTGSFNGNGNTISNLTINQSSSSGVGLFGYIGAKGSVQNLGLVDGNVSGDAYAAVGMLAGYNAGSVTNSYATGTVNSPSSTVGEGGFIGYNSGTVTDSYANVTVTGYSEVGGLIGLNVGTVTSSYAAGAVSGIGIDDVGGLVGYNPGGTVSQSYATGNASGPFDVGGLVGDNSGGTVKQSYATGTVTGTNTSQGFGVGGLVGYMYGGSVSESYATGAVSAPAYVGGLIGWTSGGSISQSYSMGVVSGTSNVGGLIGYMYGTTTTVTSSYWDTDTSYQTSSAAGTPLTTAQFQAGLPGGFDATVWGLTDGLNNGHPSLLWQLPSTTFVVTGYIYNGSSGALASDSALAGGGITIYGIDNGTSLGTVTTGANGSYNFTVVPGNLASTQLLLYTKGNNAGAAYIQDAGGPISLNIYQGYLSETGGATTLSALSAGLETAIGDNTSAQSLVNGLTNRLINATATNFTIDQAIALPNGALTLNASGSISATASVNVGSFKLANGNWSQIGGSLPSFSAQNFVIAGGSFVRALGGNGTASSPLQITDVYGLQGIGSNATTLSESYILANAIDASGTAGWNGGAGFAPIGGNSSTSFTGTLNGNGNTISGLTVNAPSTSVAGLFGFVGSSGTVENVGLTGGSVSGGVLAGDLIGLNAGTVTNSYATGAVNGSASATSIGGLIGSNEGSITGSYATGAVNGGVITGGLAGLNQGTISQSHATGTVTAGNLGIAGGLVGINLNTNTGGNTVVASITNSYATGNVSTGNGSPISTTSTAGGLVGDNFGSVSQSDASGAVTVGANGVGGGLVGQNGLGANLGQLGTASISNSYATGAVSSAGINVQLGGLIGQNDPGAQITNSQASGNVTSTASLPPGTNNNCSGSGTCEFVNVGGFVGANFGSISGTTWTSAPANCAASYACASGAVSVGALGSGGGFVGMNQGIISYAFATGQVTGAAGQADTVAGGTFDNTTSLGGFAAFNQGQIAHAFATGAVGGGGTMWLSAGGFAGSNKGTIDTSFATGAVMTGDNSTAGGFTSDNSPSSNAQNCPGCITGDGFNTSASITNSQSSGNVTVGASSVAGGFAAIGDTKNGQSGASFTNVSASGAVNADHDSIVGGLVGVLAEAGTITNSTAHNTIVASSGANSIVGGVVGFNEGTISGTSSTAPVSGTSNSYIGGITGINLGLVTGSSTDPAITGGGGSNIIGGIAGLNAGSINGSTANIAMSGGSPGYAGGVTGVNGSFSNEPALFPNSSFPNGTITNSTATGTGFSGPTGTSTPAWSPGLPAWLAGCNDAGCSVLTGGTLQTGSNTNILAASTINVNQQTGQLSQPANFAGPTTPPPLINTASLTTGDAAGTGNAANATGSTGGGSLANGRQGGNGAPPGVRLIDMPIMPLPPGTGLPPPGETRFLLDEVVLQFGPEVSPQQVTDVARRLGLIIVSQHTIEALHRTVYTFRITGGRSVAEVIRQVESAGLRVAAQPNYTYGLSQDQSGSAGGRGDPAQYIVQKLQLGAVHRITEGNNVVIALIDSQVDPRQPDFAGRIIETYDAGCGPKTPPDAHGTGMAGAIASHIGLLGVAPSAKIIAICAFGGTGTPEATSTKIIRGVDYAIAHGAKIINMSFAGPHDPALAQELQIAREKGILIIAAAGNAGAKSPPLYPGADPNVLAVTATDEHDRLFNGANQGSYVAVAAPGVNILVPAPNGDVQFTTGTSVASANVSGVAALLLAENPTRTPEEIRAILVSTAKHLGAKGVNPQFGAGLVDPLKALRFVPTTLKRKHTASAAPIQLH